MKIIIPVYPPLELGDGVYIRPGFHDFVMRESWAPSTALSQELAIPIKKAGYALGSCIGEIFGQGLDVLGILKPLGVEGQGYAKMRKDLHIGNLWLDNSERGAEHDKRWVLESFEEEHTTNLLDLTRQLAVQYDVALYLIEPSEAPRSEVKKRFC